MALHNCALRLGFVGCAAFFSCLPAGYAAETSDEILASASQIPNFSSFWIRPEGGSGRKYYPPESGPGPLENTDPNDEFMIGDPNDPLLKPAAAAAVRDQAEAGRAGEVRLPPWSLCWPTGLPLALNMAEPVQLLQQDDQVTILYQRGMTVRHIYLNTAHRDNPKPQWFGDSIGHYEGDTLVVDTIAQDTRSKTDRFGTPKSDAMRVVERYHLVDDGRRLRVDFMVEDPKTFTTPWRAYMEYVPVTKQNNHWGGIVGFSEIVCPENNRDPQGGLFAIPRDDGPYDF